MARDPRPNNAHRRLSKPHAEKGAARADVLVARLAADDWGVLATRELRACGLDDQAVSVRVRNGRLHRRHQGVYAVGHANLPLEGIFLAAVKACGPTAVLSHFSAAVLWEIFEWEERRAEVTVLGAGSRIHPETRPQNEHPRARGRPHPQEHSGHLAGQDPR
jgi:hypothetical protein